MGARSLYTRLRRASFWPHSRECGHVDGKRKASGALCAAALHYVWRAAVLRPGDPRLVPALPHDAPPHVTGLEAAHSLRRQTVPLPLRCSRLSIISTGPYAFKRKGDTIADLYCPHCLPPWEMRDVCFDQPPWSDVPLRKGQGFSCPGCRRPVLMHVRAAATHWGAIGGHLR